MAMVKMIFTFQIFSVGFGTKPVPAGHVLSQREIGFHLRDGYYTMFTSLGLLSTLMLGVVVSIAALVMEVSEVGLLRGISITFLMCSSFLLAISAFWTIIIVVSPPPRAHARCCCCCCC